MSRKPRIRDVVSWSEPARTLGDRIFDGFVSVLVDALCGTFPTMALRDSRRRLPNDPKARVRVKYIFIESGTASWMPPTWADPPFIVMSSESAWIATSGRDKAAELDLMHLRLESLVVPEDELMSGPDTVCEGRLVGNGIELKANGSWIAFAWLGYLAGWPDPGLKE